MKNAIIYPPEGIYGEICSKPNSKQAKQPRMSKKQIHTLSSITFLPSIIKCTPNFCGLIWNQALQMATLRWYYTWLGWVLTHQLPFLYVNRNQSHTYTEGIQPGSSAATRRLKRHSQGQVFRAREHTNSHLHFRPLLSRTNCEIITSCQVPLFSALPGLGKECSL